MTTDATRQQLDAVQAYLFRLLEHVGKIEAERDRLILALADAEGCHHARPTALR